MPWQTKQRFSTRKKGAGVQQALLTVLLNDLAHFREFWVPVEFPDQGCFKGRGLVAGVTRIFGCDFICLRTINDEDSISGE